MITAMSDFLSTVLTLLLLVTAFAGVIAWARRDAFTDLPHVVRKEPVMNQSAHDHTGGGSRQREALPRVTEARSALQARPCQQSAGGTA